jgi:DNA processing protein
MLSLNGSKIMLALALKYNGDWSSIYSAVQSKTSIEEDEIESLIAAIPSDVSYVTIVDPNYPDNFKRSYKPPFCLFYKGDLNMINNPKLTAVIGDIVWDEHQPLFYNNADHAFALSDMNNATILKLAYNKDSVFFSSLGILDYQNNEKLSNFKFGLIISEHYTTPKSKNESEMLFDFGFSLRLPVAASFFTLFTGIKSRKHVHVAIAQAYALFIHKPLAVFKTSKDSTNNDLINDSDCTGVSSLNDIYTVDSMTDVDISRLS